MSPSRVLKLGRAALCGIWLPVVLHGCGSDKPADETVSSVSVTASGSSAPNTTSSLSASGTTSSPLPSTTQSNTVSSSAPTASLPPTSSSSAPQPTGTPTPTTTGTPPASTSTGTSTGSAPSETNAGGAGGAPGASTSAPTTDPSTSGGAGGMGPATGAGGMAGETSSGPIVPVQSGTSYTLDVGDVQLEVDGPTGRITGLKLGTAQLLGQKGTEDPTLTNYGSTFWTSPQSDWNWPPPFEAVAYTHSLDTATNQIVIESDDATWTDASVRLLKRISGDAERQAIVIEYGIENTGSSALSVAPWEVTRVASDGLAFFPEGSAAPTAAPDRTALTISASDDGIVWYDLSAQDPDFKSRADGAEGWLAHVNDGVLLVKQFEDIAANASAPDHGEVEIYHDAAYVELEPQGPYASIAAGATSPTWRVTWYVRAVPADMDVSVGSAALVEMVRGLVAE